MSLVNHQQNSMENQPVLRSILTDSFSTFNNQAESQLMQEVIEQSYVEKNHILYHSVPDVSHVPTGKAMHEKGTLAGDIPSITTLNQTGSKSIPIIGTLKQTSCKPSSLSILNQTGSKPTSIVTLNQTGSKPTSIVTLNQTVSKPTPTRIVTLNQVGSKSSSIVTLNQTGNNQTSILTLNQTGSKPTSIVTLPSSNSGINTHGNG